jgi:signal transduction histidine kinase
VVADEERVQQVLLNLLTNAIKFTEPGGLVSLSCDVGDGTVQIRVRDTGRGIRREDQEKIFEPFVQVDRSPRDVNHGVGLGLAISRDLARRMQGDVTLESEVGLGSTFTLVLPRSED